MEKRLKEKMLRVLFLLVLLLLFLNCNAYAQAVKGNVGDAVKEAQAAGVPPTLLNHLLTLGYENQVEPQAMMRFIQTLTEVRREEFPVEPFTNKIEEGLAKRVPVSVIQQVLSKKLEDYRFTLSLIKDNSKKQGKRQTIPPEYLLRFSESLSCGISRENLRLLLESAFFSSPLPTLAMAIEMLASLEQNQVNPATAQQIVIAGLKENYFTPDKRDFSRIIVIAKQKGVSEQTIANVAIDTIQNKGTIQDIASRLGITAADLSQGPVISKGGRGGAVSEGKGSRSIGGSKGSAGSSGSGPSGGGQGAGGPGDSGGSGGGGAGGAGGGGSGGSGGGGK
jgi:hypothetical protein